MLVLADGVPLVATDPWLIGSAYWRSWWLEKYPTADEIDLVRRARCLYVPHSHPDHFH
jgi:UDP-MurNAc hydroxylase